MTAPIASNTLGVNVFTAPGKAMVGERPKPFGEAFGFDPITSTCCSDFRSPNLHEPLMRMFPRA